MSSENRKPFDVIDKMAGAKNNPELLNLFDETKDINNLSNAKLDLKDYFAIFIALMETVFLPIIVLMLVLIGLSLLLQVFA